MTKQVYDYFVSIFTSMNVAPLVARYMTEFLFIAVLLMLSTLAFLLSKKIITVSVGKVHARVKSKLTRTVLEFLDAQTVKRSLLLIIAIILYALRNIFLLLSTIVEITLIIYISLMSVSILNMVLNKINLLYDSNYKHAKSKPIKGLFTVIKGLVFGIVLVIIISKLVGKSPIYILSGIGALSAILLLIFKDSLLGFVAGFQMSSNDLVRIGDWIEMPKYGADGDVIDITLSFVKVRNWDKTIVTIPAYALVSESFKNWRGMFATGGRRIKRSINIDITSIAFCSEEQIEQLLQIDFLKDYINERTKEIAQYNIDNNVNTAIPINGRRLTNIGVFRKYITEYIKRHPKVHKELIAMVRQLQSDSTGIPLEIYAFTNETSWINYEDIMSDIFDHIYASATFFGLKIYQEPSGLDIREITK